MIRPKDHHLTHLQYYLITNDAGFAYSDYLTAPAPLNRYLRHFIKLVPIDLLQLINPSLYYNLRCNRMISGWLDLVVQYIHNFNEHFRFLDNPGVKVVLIDKLSLDETKNVLMELVKQKNYYFTFFDEEIANGPLRNLLPASRFFVDELDLIQKLIADKDIIAEYLASDLPDYKTALYRNFDLFDTATQVIPELERIPLFKGAHPNFFVMNQINGNYWLNGEAIDDFSMDEKKEVSKKSLFAKPDDENIRSSILIDQVKIIDGYWRENFIDTTIGQSDPTLNALILVLPFQNPQSEKLAHMFHFQMPKEFVPSLTAEQNFNYIFLADSKSDKLDEVSKSSEVMAFQMIAREIIVPKLDYLDFISFLHAGYQFSPCYRFPLVGKSIYRELSFLKPNTRNSLSGAKLNKTIGVFSQKLNQRVLTEEFEKYLSERNGQIVAVTDLPIELLDLKGLPLMLTHDVCRIPETNYRSSIASYMINNKFQYTVPRDILRKTLIILGASKDPNFEATNEMVKNATKESGIACIECLSVADFLKTVNSFEPELLVVDCHGGFDEESLSTHLIINGEKLNADDILKIDKPIPLVFLSACSTSPTFGYVHSIANVFLNKGSFSVTTTMLPIDIERGTLTYYRLLMMLDQAATSGNFQNWLAYTAFIIRTAAFTDIVRKVMTQTESMNRSKKNTSDKILKQIEAIINRTVGFAGRWETFSRINQLVNNLDENIRINFNNTVHEHLLYSHMGRSDLILFESWSERKRTILNKLRPD